jgi:hypothetical protein
MPGGGKKDAKAKPEEKKVEAVKEKGAKADDKKAKGKK